MPDQAHLAQNSEPSSSSVSASAALACDELRRSVMEFQLPLPPTSVCEELYVQVERAATMSARSMKGLRLAVEHFAAALKKEGASPEATLIVLKKIINSRTFPTSSWYEGEIAGEELRQQISTWAIDAFFKSSG